MLKDRLTAKKLPISAMVSVMHDKMEPAARDICLQVFHSGSSRVLITSESLGVEINTQQVSLVINYDIPSNRESYIRRIGRVGRHGRKGVTINIVSDKEMPKIREIESLYATVIGEMPDNVAELI